MREHLGFLETSSAVVKIAAWIFLLLGAINGISIILGILPSNLGIVPNNSRLEGAVVLAITAFLFFLSYIIAKIADLLIKIINEIHELKANNHKEVS